MLYIFFDFFCNKVCATRTPRCCLDHDDGNDEPNVVTVSSHLNRESYSPSKPLVPNKQDLHAKAYRAQIRSPWFRITQQTQKHPWAVVIIVLALGVPMYVFLPKLTVTFDLFVQVPRDGAHLPGFRAIMSSFNAGQTTPYYVAMGSNKTNGIWSDEFFTAAQTLIYAVVAETGFDLSHFTSVFVVPVPGAPGSYLNVTPAMARNVLLPTHPEYRFLWNRTTTADNASAIVELFTPFAPLGTQAKPF
eukprot:PhM_4_TR10582/c0_g2_i1/m.13277